MKRVDMSNVQENREFKRVTPGAYICNICSVEDLPDKEQLRVSYDIAEGEFAGYYTKTLEEHPEWTWLNTYTKSYKPTAAFFFKRFCTAVSKSNGNFVFDAGKVNSDEKTLVGKKIGLVLREEEYYSNSGELRTKLVVDKEFPIDALKDQKIPKKKELSSGSDEVMPF